MDFVYLFRILLKRKWIILGSALIAAAVAFFLTQNETKKFRSTTQVATGYTTYDPIKLVNENTGFFEQETKFNNVIVTFSSPTVLSLLSYKLILHDLTQKTPFRKLEPDLDRKVFATISKDSAIKAFRSKEQSMDMLSPASEVDSKLLNILSAYGYDISSLSKSLIASRLQRTDYLNIDFVSEDPNLSAFAVNTAYNEFISYYGNNRSAAANQSIDTLRSIVEKKKQILDEKNALLQQAGFGGSMSAESSIDVISALESNLASEKSRLSTLQADYRKVTQRLASLGNRPAETTVDNNDLIVLREAMNNANADYLRSNDPADLKRYNDLKAKYSQKVTQSRSSSNSSLAKDPIAEKTELMAQKTDLEIDIQSSNSLVGSLQGKINALRGGLNSEGTRAAVIESLKKDADLASKEYLEATQRYNSASDIKGVSLVNFRVILPGQVPVGPEPSKRYLIIALAAIAALFTTIAIIVFLTYLDSSVRTPIIFSKNVNLKLISLVNFMSLKNKNIQDVIANKHKALDAAEHKRNNIFRESIRKLRYEIEMSGKKTFLFTSTKKGQGKTTLIQALSYSLSLSKKRVLIIDTNFCNNDLTVQLNAEPVLEKIVPYKSDNQALLEQVKVFSKDLGLGGVYAIGSEGGDYTPSEILPRENLLQHLPALTADFDYIFLEGPPLNDFSDSKELAQYVDGVIAVFSAQTEIKQIDKQSITFYRELNGKFIGSILNMVDLKNINVA
jgi:uncharacterized protein involved in exopolysaccharide biosynthesis/Mrp family chromosome partitioning ATPase